MFVPRSFLFVPGDSVRKMEKGESCGAHALILDLEDSVAAANLEGARKLVRNYLVAHPDRSRQQLWVRVNPVQTDACLADLAEVVGGAPDGVMLPKCEGGQDVARLDHYLSALERRDGVAPGSIRIMSVATETPAAMFELGSYRGASPRLYGLTWGAEDLSTVLGASSNKADTLEYAFPYQLARSLCLLGSKSGGLQAIDTVLPNFRDAEGLAREVRRARQDGFTAKIAIHPDQVATINDGFCPNEEEIERARKIVAAFRSAAHSGTIQVDGHMVDRPHLTQAMQILKSADIRD